MANTNIATIGHHYLHVPKANATFFDSRNLTEKEENQAQNFALLAIIPLPLLKAIEEIPDLLDYYPPHLIKQRLQLWQDYRI